MFTNYTHLIMFILGGLFNLMKYMYKVVFPVNDIITLFHLGDECA